MNLKSALQPLDYAVLGAYILVLIIIGTVVSWRRRHSDDHFLGGRSFGWCNIGLAVFSTNIGPSFLIASAGAAYATGMVTANFEWLAWVFLLVLGMVFIPHYLNTGITTMPQFIERRFGRACSNFLSAYALLTTFVIWLGITLLTGGILLNQLLGWSFTTCVVTMTILAMVVTVFGGLAAVIVTDSFQAILIILGAGLMTVLALIKAGGIGAVFSKLPPHYLTLIQPAGAKEYAWPAMFLGYPILGIWFWCTDQTIVQRLLGARSLQQAQLSAVFTGFLKILPPMLFMLPGLICFVMHPGLAKADDAFITMVIHYLPTGMVGLILAVLIAALISTLESGLNSFSTLFTLDIYMKLFRPQASGREKRLVGQAMTVIIGALSILIALWLSRFDKRLFDLSNSLIAYFAPPMAVVFLLGVLWRRATSTAAFWTLVLGSIVSVSVGLCELNKIPQGFVWPHFLYITIFLFAGIGAFMIVLSLLSKNAPSEEQFPTLRETYKKMYAGKEHQARQIWMLWGVLAAIMAGIYIYFW